MARAATRAATKKKSTIRVNFSGVETSSVIPEGEYIAIVKAAKVEETDKGNEYIAWEMTIRDGKYAKKTLYHNTSLQEQSLWATKRWLECLGIDVPDGEMDVDFDELEGLATGVVVEHDTYKGRTRSKIIDSFPAEEGGEDDAGGEEKGDEGDLPTADEIGEMGKADLRKLVEEHDLDVELAGTTSAQRRLVIKALEAKAAEGASSKKGASKAGGKTTAAKKSKKVKLSVVMAMDEDELQECVETHELDIDLSDFTNLRKKRGAVSEALEEAEKLDDDSE